MRFWQKRRRSDLLVSKRVVKGVEGGSSVVGFLRTIFCWDVGSLSWGKKVVNFVCIKGEFQKAVYKLLK